jgi:hypothetical protein
MTVLELPVPILMHMCIMVMYDNYEGYLCDRSARVPGSMSCICLPQGRKLCMQAYMRENNFAVCRNAVLDGIVSAAAGERWRCRHVYNSP